MAHGLIIGTCGHFYAPGKRVLIALVPVTGTPRPVFTIRVGNMYAVGCEVYQSDSGNWWAEDNGLPVGSAPAGSASDAAREICGWRLLLTDVRFI